MLFLVHLLDIVDAESQRKLNILQMGELKCQTIDFLFAPLIYNTCTGEYM